MSHVVKHPQAHTHPRAGVEWGARADTASLPGICQEPQASLGPALAYRPCGVPGGRSSGVFALQMLSPGALDLPLQFHSSCWKHGFGSVPTWRLWVYKTGFVPSDHPAGSDGALPHGL